MVNTIICVFTADRSLGKLLFVSVGVYSVVLILSWLPRCLARLNVISYLDSNIFLYFSNLAYFIIFLYEQESLRLFEKNAETMFVQTDQDSIYISWQLDSFVDSRSHSQERESLTKMSHSLHTPSTLSRSILKVVGLIGSTERKDEDPAHNKGGTSSAHTSASRNEISAIPSDESFKNIEAGISPVEQTNRPVSGNFHSYKVHSGTSSAHTSAGRNELSPIEPQLEEKKLDHRNRPISANLVGNMIDSSNIDVEIPKSSVINYRNIARYSMHIDESNKKYLKKSTETNLKATPHSDKSSSRPNSRRPLSLRLALFSEEPGPPAQSNPASQNDNHQPVPNPMVPPHRMENVENMGGEIKQSFI